MNPRENRAKRIVVPLIVLAGAAIVAAVVIFGPGSSPPPPPPGPDETADRAPTPALGAPVTDEPTDGAPGRTLGDGAERPDDGAMAGADAATDDAPPTDAVESLLEGLRVRPAEPGADDDERLRLGSLDPREAFLMLECDPRGAGLRRITLAGFWETALSSRQAEAHWSARAAGASPEDAPPLPPAEQRYVLDTSQPFVWWDADGNRRMTDVPALATHSIRVNDAFVSLLGPKLWRVTGPGAFEAIIENAEGAEVLRVTRAFELLEDGEILVRQGVESLVDVPMDVQWIQYGPGDLQPDRSRYMDRRRFRFGPQIELSQSQYTVLPSENDLLFERSSVIKLDRKAHERTDPARAQEIRRLWPTEQTRREGWKLAWFASTNRYFAMAIHRPPPVDSTSDMSIEYVVDEVLLQASVIPRPDGSEPEGGEDTESVFTVLYGPTTTLGPGQSLRLDLGLYAGPLDPHVLGGEEPFRTLRMDGLILYQMSSFCAICTFQWLAKLLIGFLELLHGYMVFDWGLAIIGLVVVVRLLLHPISKKSQINMQRFGKQMQALKPEIDKIQKRYADDPKRAQQEQLRVMREHGMNPAQALGCLPMFLQMPIWVALYAGLYFAFELRQQPAFFGVFQFLWDWPFLADLSASDHFGGAFADPKRILLWNITGINVLPILMGLMFYVQQKYLSPPPSPNMTDEQKQQQKIMRWMMVLMFPLMLYSAPSGLTLYIMTSTAIGVLEGRYIRRHIDELDKNPPPVQTVKKKARVNRKDPQARAYADALKRAQEKRRKKSTKSYKRRDK